MLKELEKICKPAVFETIFKKYARDVKQFVFFKTQDMDQAEDILQETFVKLWENCDRVSYSKVKGFLYTTANNLFLNWFKHRNVVRNHEKSSLSRNNPESPEFVMLEKEFLEKIEKAIADLPDTQREVFLMSRMEKKKYAEISEILGISVKAVEKRMHQALKIMREKIGNV
ncbi:RNA polymerase sigma-70 factor [Aureisphaera galaxeae]|uniref:RNA polymerase sigma factor n=1 Tax=Aureisphaera galaxeae TaxID=1538023 RepID=UPI0023507F92|nr:RNA polymerase sigma-70 factor [Aureisphaera galaxeae]MDC8004786.1 RNA polymerase sigma-70 factor [Aureisphaera galaxeae]